MTGLVVAAVVLAAGFWVDQGGVLDAFPPQSLPTAADLDRAHAAVMADAEILTGNRPAPDTSWVVTRDIRDAYPRRRWLRGILRGSRGRHGAGDPGDEGRDRGQPVDARGGGEAAGGAEGSGAGTR